MLHMRCDEAGTHACNRPRAGGLNFDQQMIRLRPFNGVGLALECNEANTIIEADG